MRRGVILVCGIGGLSRRVPDSAGMATPGVPLVQLLTGIKSLGHTFYVSGMLAVLANKGLVSTLEHVGHFRLLCKLLVGFVVAIYIYILNRNNYIEVLGDARALPVCNVGTLLTHDGKDVKLSHCV